MKHFWALPAIVRVALASQHAFSVLDDLLAFPQYRIVFSETGITPEHARSLTAASLADKESKSEPDSTVELSHQTYAHDSAQNPFKNPDNGESHDGKDDEDTPSTYETLIWQSQPYLCRIPKISSSTDPTNASTPTAAEEETELMRATDRGWELLSGMEGNCIYFLSGWWSYSFCYNGEIKQFHQLPPSRGVPYYPPVEDETVQSYILGQFPEPTEDGKSKGEENRGEGATEGDGEGSDYHASRRRAKSRIPADTSVARLETKGETRYLVQKLSGGTICDLTGKDRKIEVQFHCHPNTPDRIGMIKEVATCAYLMVIYTPRLCNDVAFQPPTENRAHAIDCAPVVEEDGLAPPPPPKHRNPAPSGSHDTNIDIPDTLGDSAAQTSAPLPTIGGTVVGAKALVGDTPERMIEKSVVVGGGKETVLGTVASSDGQGKITTMKTEELRKLEIKDPRDIENLKRKLTSLAGKKGWRLELVETPRGREFRGVIEADDGEDEDAEEVITDREGGKASRKKGHEGDDGKDDGEEGEQEESVEEGSEETFFTEEL